MSKKRRRIAKAKRKLSRFKQELLWYVRIKKIWGLTKQQRENIRLTVKRNHEHKN